MKCYNFCQQYKYDFAMAKAKKSKRIPFKAFFLLDQVLFE